MNEDDLIPLRPEEPDKPTPPPLPPPLPRMLNYGGMDMAPRHIAIWQIFVGMVLSAGVLFTGVVLVLMASDFIRSNAAFYAIIGAFTVLINIGSIFIFRTETMRGLAIGFWIGEGLLLLLAGACFSILL
ncbi:MAG: hypothetical protein IT447_14880 [Phycisphaerales bacterium]|jgi:hypothetical protein|nr:hypothetical protein [Phycisphaerales bacterium]